MGKQIVFISHITEEKEMAMELKKLIEESFLGMLEVFVSSDENSISSGSRWLDNITFSLGNCAIELILCSPKSVKRPWINFEAGAGWVREIPVIPLCHSGMEPSQLPIPLNLLQAAKISDISSLKLIFPVLADAIGSKKPNVVFDDFVGKIKDLEKKYTFWEQINGCLKELSENYNKLFMALGSNNVIKTQLTEVDIREINKICEQFVKREYVKIVRAGDTFFTGAGVFYAVTILISEEFRNLLNKRECIYSKLC